VKLCQVLDERPGVGRTLSRQLLRSGTSIGANIEEAQAGQSRADFLSKYSIALKEARETLYWLRLIAECEIIASLRLAEITLECDELVAILTTIVKNTRTGS
jgi:four helix bundle protein